MAGLGRLFPSFSEKMTQSPLRAPNETPFCPVGLDTCLRRYDTKKTVIPVETGIQGGGAGVLTNLLRAVLSVVLRDPGAVGYIETLGEIL